MIAVADDGAGMHGEVRTRAFEPFFTTRQQQGGSGLGLSMVYGFVEQASGHAAIDSAPGRGCTVTMTLPCADAPAQRAEAVQETVRPGRGDRVLVVEDDAAVRSYVVRALRTLGYETSATGDPLAALAMLEEGMQCDLLLTDILMPGAMGGVELGRRVRQARPGLPIVYMTGYADCVVDKLGQSIPPGHLLHKPFRRAELGRTIGACIGHGQGLSVAAS
jgi:CheY-like chemotaxis protein